MSSDYFRYFRSSDPDFGGLDFLSSIGLECHSVFCPVGSSAWLSSALSSGSEVSISSALMSSAPQISAPAAVNPSVWDFVGSGLGIGWDVLGLVWLSVYTQSEVDHLSKFQSEVDHGLKNEVDQEFKKIQVDHGSKIKTQVDLGFKKICSQMCN